MLNSNPTCLQFNNYKVMKKHDKERILEEDQITTKEWTNQNMIWTANHINFFMQFKQN